MFIYCFPVHEEIATANTNLALNMNGRKLNQVKHVEISDHPWTIRFIDGEIWCCQSNGVSVYDTTLTTVRRIDTGGVLDVVLLPGENIFIAGSALCKMSKSGIENYSLKMFHTEQ